MKLFLLCLLAVGAFAAPSRRNVFPRFYTGIVGGTNAADGEFPYQISFQDTSYVVPFHFCGGSIYNNQWIITAAHCVAGENFDNPQQLRIVAGDLTHSSSGSTAQSPAVDKIVQHEAYSSRTLENDIALLRVADSLIFDSFVAPIALPAPGQDTTGDCVVTGWGATSEAGNAASILQKVTVPVVSDDECRADYSAIQITDSMICAGLPQGGVDSCQGDSGGPMACSGYLGGIVSWGTGCARPGKPGVYTEVSYFVDWVLANAV